MVEVTKVNPQTVGKIEKQLRIVAHVIKQKGRGILTQYDMSPPQFVALQWLLDEGEMTVGELSNKMYLAFSTTTDLINRMEKNELIRRVKDDKDKRMVRIQLLEKGHQIIELVIKTRQDYLKTLLNNIADLDIIGFEKGLESIYKQVKTEL